MSRAASPKPAGGGGGKGPKMNRVRVVVRLRPLFVRGEDSANANAIQFDEAGKVLWVMPRDETDKKNRRQFDFDGLVGPNGTQKDAFLAVLPTLESILEGVNGCVMCYGQTGSGKTFTLSKHEPGKPDIDGVMPRAFTHLFEKISADSEHDYQMSAQYVQIYLEGLYDLLRPESDLALREEPGGQVYLTGADSRPVASMQDCMAILDEGLSNRATSKTLMNAESSRSHAMFILTLVRSGGPSMMTNTSQLFLVDLAGSERIKKSGVTNEGKDEAISINASLTTLGRCIQAMANKKGGIKPPFRESKLTRLLQTALSGGGRTSLIVCASMGDSDVQETNSSLEFAQQAMRVKVAEVRREKTDFSALVIHLQNQVDAFEDKGNLMQKEVYDKVRAQVVKAQAELHELRGLRTRVANLKKINGDLQAQEAQADVIKSKTKAKPAASKPKVEEALKKIKMMQQELDEANKERDAVTVMLPEIAAEYRELGGHAWHNGDTAKAQSYYEKALNAYTKCMGPEHPEVACSMGDLANVYCDQGRFPNALELYQQAHAIHAKAFGPDHVDTAGDLASLGLVHAVQGNHKEALPLLKDAYDIMGKSLEPGHPNLVQVKQFLDKTAEVVAA